MPFMYQPTLGQDAVMSRSPYQRPGAGGGANGSTGGGTYYAPNPEYAVAQENYAAADKAYKNALARLNTQRSGLLRQAGYVGDVDPNTGMVKNVRVDAGNSFGGLQQLLHNAANEDMNADYAAEDRGLVGGLAHQGEAELHYQHQGQMGDLVNSLMSGLAGYDDQQQQAKEALDQALFDLSHTAAQTAVDNGEFNPAPPPGGGSGGSGGGGSHVGSIPAAVAAHIVRTAIAHGEPVSEHGLGQMRAPSRMSTRRPIPNAYTSGRKRRG